MGEFFSGFRNKVLGVALLASGAAQTGAVFEAKRQQREAQTVAEFTQKDSDELKEIEGETPKEIKEKLGKILQLVKDGKIDKESITKIDLGVLIITKMKADGLISPEEAQELREILYQKRASYKELAKNKDMLSVLHLVSQEHRVYHKYTTDLGSFLKTGTSNCRGALAGYAAEIQGIYPDLKLFVQGFSGSYDDHVRLIFEINGQWFAIEQSGVTPIELAPGSTVTPLSELVTFLAEKTITAKKIDGDTAPIPAPDKKKVKEIQAEDAQHDDNKNNDVIAQMYAAIPERPTASYTNAPTPTEPISLKPRTIEEAQAGFTPQQLERFKATQTHLEFEKTKKEGKLKVDVVDLDNSITFDFDKKTMSEAAMKQKMDELLSLYEQVYSISDEIQQGENYKQRLLTLYGIAKKGKDNLKGFLYYLKDHPNGKKIITSHEFLTDIMYGSVNSKTLEFTGGGNLEVSPLSQQGEKEYTTNSVIQNREFDLRSSFLDIENEKVYGLIPKRLNENDVKDIAELTHRQGIALIGDKFNTLEVPVTSLKESWFTNLHFQLPNNEKGGAILEFFKFNSRDVDLSFLDRPDIQIIQNLTINAPIADLSVIEKLKVQALDLQNISPLADLSTIKPHADIKKKFKLFITNIDPYVDVSRLDKDINTLLTFNNLDTLTPHRKQLGQVRFIDILADGQHTDLGALTANKSIEVLRLTGVDIYDSDRAILKTMKALRVIHVYRQSDNSKKMASYGDIAEWIAFSRFKPAITLVIDNPEYIKDYESKYKSKTLVIQDGRVTGNQ